MSPSFKSYSMTNMLFLSIPPSSCYTYSQLVAMVVWVVHSSSSSRRRSGAERLTGETVGIRLSVRLSVSVLQAGSLDRRLSGSTVEVLCPVCVVVRVYGSDPESGDEPCMSAQKREKLLSFLS